MAEINKKIYKIELTSEYKRNLILMRGEQRCKAWLDGKCFPTLKQFCKYTGLGNRIYALFLQVDIDPALLYRNNNSRDFYNELIGEFSEIRKRDITHISCWVEARRQYIQNKQKKK